MTSKQNKTYDSVRDCSSDMVGSSVCGMLIPFLFLVELRCLENRLCDCDTSLADPTLRLDLKYRNSDGLE